MLLPYISSNRIICTAVKFNSQDSITLCDYYIRYFSPTAWVLAMVRSAQKGGTE